MSGREGDHVLPSLLSPLARSPVLDASRPVRGSEWGQAQLDSRLFLPLPPRQQAVNGRPRRVRGSASLNKSSEHGRGGVKH